MDKAKQLAERLRNDLSGQKTYIVGLVIFVVGGLTALGYEIPEWAFEALSGLGLIALRAGVAKSE